MNRERMGTMKFNLYLLADQVKEYTSYIGRASQELTLRHACIMEGNTSCLEDTVYVLSTDSIELLERQNPSVSLSFILLCPDEILAWNTIRTQLPEGWNFLFFRTMQPPSDVYYVLIESISKLNDWYEDLAEAILHQVELQQQMDIAARFLKNPVALFDLSMSLLAWSGPMPENTQDPVWSRVLTQGYVTIEAFPADDRKPVYESLGDNQVLIAPPMGKKNTCHNMTATLHHQGMPYACLAMNELIRPFDGAEYSYVCIIKKMLESSPVLLRSIALAGDQRSGLFLCLLRGQKVSEPQLEIFLREHGWGINDSFVLYLFRYQSSIINKQSYRSHMQMIQRAVPDLELVYFENSLVAVDRNQSGPESLRRLQLIEEKLPIPIGVSMRYQGYIHLREAFLQAQAALKYTGWQAGFSRYEDIFSQYLLELLNANNNLLHLCHPALLKLNLETEWDRELLSTLYCYLQKGKRVSSTAEELHIHRNTLLNRLRILDDILQLKIDELSWQEEQLIYISCMILHPF